MNEVQLSVELPEGDVRKLSAFVKSQCEQETRALQAEIDRLRQAALFGLRVLEDARENLGSDVGGDDIQDWAIAHGLLKSVTVSEPCGDDCSCEEYGDFPQECLRYSDLTLALIRRRAGETR